MGTVGGDVFRYQRNYAAGPQLAAPRAAKQFHDKNDLSPGNRLLANLSSRYLAALRCEYIRDSTADPVDVNIYGHHQFQGRILALNTLNVQRHAVFLISPRKRYQTVTKTTSINLYKM